MAFPSQSSYVCGNSFEMGKAKDTVMSQENLWNVHKEYWNNPGSQIEHL